MFVKRLVGHSLLYAIGPQIPRIVTLFTFPLLTRYLTAVDFGVYGVVNSYLALLLGISDLGFSVVMINSFYRYPNKWKFVWRQLHFYILVWSFMYSGLLSCVILFFTPDVININNKIVLIFLCSFSAIVFNPVILIGSRYYQYSSRPKHLAIQTAVSGLVTVGLNVYTIAFLRLGYMGWFISTFFGALVQFLFMILPVYKQLSLAPLVSFRKKFLFNSLKISLPIIPHNYSTYLLNSSDRLIMDQLKVPVSEIGKYNVAYIFANYFEFFGNAMGMAIGPMLSKLIAARNKVSTLFQLTIWLQTLFIVGGCLVSLWIKELFQLLFAKEIFRSVYPISIIIVMGYTYRPYYWLVISKLQYEERTKELWRISFIAGFLNVILNLLFIPWYGIWAAAIITYFSLIYIGFSGYFMKVFKQIDRANYYPLWIIFIIVVLTLLIYLLRDSSISLKIFISTIFVFCFLVYTLRIKETFSKIL